MNRDEARAIAEGQIDELRKLTWSQLRERYLERPQTSEVAGESGTTYQLEIGALWDGAEGGDIRVCVCIDDGGWRALMPLCVDFIVASDGSFVGE